MWLITRKNLSVNVSSDSFVPEYILICELNTPTLFSGTGMCKQKSRVFFVPYLR